VKAHPFAKHSLDPIADGRVPYFLGHRDPEPARKLRIRSLARNPENVSTMGLGTFGLDGEKVCALSQTHLFGNPKVSSTRRQITSWLQSPRCACDPSRDGDGELHVHHGSSCERESHACACGSCYAVDTYASTWWQVFPAAELAERDRYSSTPHKSRHRRSCTPPVHGAVAVSTPLFFDGVPEFTWPRFQLATRNPHLLPTRSFSAVDNA
jgi:hypothetical protein